ncbi:hypothetical protein [Halococcus hamelinensis]|uniref:hypothetical protein n=1 Tax=Halococcus hamelinensis TaxID=332168 RepID=UPI000A61E205|nr:hypothetical protein [Halococcus hamelinensis]
MSEPEDSVSDRRGWLLATSSFVAALLIIISSALPFLLPTGWWPTLDLSPSLSGLNFGLLPAIFLLIAYPVFISRTTYRYPVTIDDVIDQLAFVFFLCPGAMFAEVAIVYLVTYGWSVIRPASEAGWSLSGVGWSFVVLFPATAMAVLLGLPLIIIAVYIGTRFADWLP